jgi:hypothetical protein
MERLTVRHIDPWLLDFVRPRGGVLTVRDAEYVVG